MELTVKSFGELTKDELYDILALRFSVFVIEQNRVCREIDGEDRNALHVILSDSDGIAAYLRLLPLSQEEVLVGRVIAKRRGQGLGKEVLRCGVEAAKTRLGAQKITVHAQQYAQLFYEKCGFEAVSEPYMEDGCPHVVMTYRGA